MNTMKRLEISITALGVPRLLEMLDNLNIKDYNVITGVTGKRNGREVAADLDFLRAFNSNNVIIAYCSSEMMEDVIEQLYPVVHKFDGLCYISDSVEMREMQTMRSPLQSVLSV